jgi:hypothetical protein
MTEPTDGTDQQRMQRLICTSARTPRRRRELMALHTDNLSLADRRIFGRESRKHAMTQPLCSPMSQVPTTVDLNRVESLTGGVAIRLVDQDGAQSQLGRLPWLPGSVGALPRSSSGRRDPGS